MKEFCQKFAKSFSNTHEGFSEIVLNDGRTLKICRTDWGDGTYKDQFGNAYPVDSGNIGVIALEDIPNFSKSSLEDFGAVHSFKKFEQVTGIFTEYFNGDIQIGSVIIKTDDEED